METIIVDVTIGALNEEVQFMLPAHVPVKQLLDEIVRQVCRVFANVDFDESAMLCNLDTMAPVQPEWTLAANGVQDGSRLALI